MTSTTRTACLSNAGARKCRSEGRARRRRDELTSDFDDSDASPYAGSPSELPTRDGGGISVKQHPYRSWSTSSVCDEVGR